MASKGTTQRLRTLEQVKEDAKRITRSRLPEELRIQLDARDAARSKAKAQLAAPAPKAPRPQQPAAPRQAARSTSANSKPKAAAPAPKAPGEGAKEGNE